MASRWHEDTKGYRVYPGVVRSEAAEAEANGCDGLMIIAPDFSPGAYDAAEEIENDPNSPITDVILRIESM
jgi:hypothetical protein